MCRPQCGAASNVRPLSGGPDAHPQKKGEQLQLTSVARSPRTNEDTVTPEATAAVATSTGPAGERVPSDSRAAKRRAPLAIPSNKRRHPPTATTTPLTAAAASTTAPTVAEAATDVLAATGLAADGLAVAGLTATGLTATGLAATGPLDTMNNNVTSLSDAPATHGGRPPAAATPTTQDTATRADQTSMKRTAGDRPEQFQSALELPPAKSSFNLSQDKEREKQGNHPYG